MVIRHRRFGSLPPMSWSSHTTRTRSYDAMPASLASRSYLMSSPVSRTRHGYERGAEDYLHHRVSDAGLFSSVAMEEGYDTARRSRNRDAQLLRNATDAIVHSESFATPQASVAARRVIRGGSMVPLRSTSVPPRPLYPVEVDLWDRPRSYESLYRMKSAVDTTTTHDDYYYPEVSYARRPLLFYPNPWLHRPRSQVAMPRAAARAVSVPPRYLYAEDEPPRRPLTRPVFDDWRRMARAISVAADERPYYHARHPSLYYPYAGGYGGYGAGGYERRLSPYYMRRLALSQPRHVFQPHLALPTEGMRAHWGPRYISRVAVRAGIPFEWEDRASKHRRAEDEEELALFGRKSHGFRPRVLASPLARASLARAWKHSAHPFTPVYVKNTGYGFPMVFVARKGPKQGGGRPKAALIASRMDVDAYKGRRPRSDYAARKYRTLHVADKESIYMNSPQTAGYYASTPSGPKLTERKAIRTEEGYSKPKNLLSWQPQPSAAGPRSKVLSKVVVRRPGMIGREQVVNLPFEEVLKRSRFLGAPVKYFPSPYDFPDPRLNVLPRGLVTISPLPKKAEDGDDGGASERQRSSVKIPNYYACGVDPANPPMSDLRRRIRRTLNKAKRS